MSEPSQGQLANWGQFRSEKVARGLVRLCDCIITTHVEMGVCLCFVEMINFSPAGLGYLVARVLINHLAGYLGQGGLRRGQGFCPRADQLLRASSTSWRRRMSKLGRLRNTHPHSEEHRSREGKGPA